MPDLSPQESSLIAAISDVLEKRDEERREADAKNGRVWRRVLAVKDIVIAIIFFGSLLGAAAITFQRLADKPTNEQMHKAIEIEERGQKREEAITIIKTDVKRSKEVQEVLLEQNAYQARVLEHIANKKRGAPPQKPEELEQKETDLMK